MGWAFVFAFVFGLSAKLETASAQTPRSARTSSSTRDSAVARALFREGVACADARDWACAADRFAQAREVRPSAVLTYNLGHALIELGRVVEGTEILTQLLRDSTLRSSIRADAERTLDIASRQISQLSIQVIGPTEGTTFTLDGRELAGSLLGTAIPVDPGERRIEAHHAGELVAHALVIATAGEPVVATLTLPEHPSPSEAPPTDLALSQLVIEPHEESDDAPWIALGISGAILVIGGAITLGIVLSSPSSDPVFDGNLGHVEIGRGQ